MKKNQIDVDYLLKTNDIKDFDNLYSAKIFGFNGAEDYYVNASCVTEMKNINVPLLCFNAKDDQISFKESIPFENIKQNKNIGLIFTSHGTHNCFIENDGIFGVKQWAPRQAIAFLKNCC